jgi:hypothetical protein
MRCSKAGVINCPLSKNSTLRHRDPTLYPTRFAPPNSRRCRSSFWDQAVPSNHRGIFTLPDNSLRTPVCIPCSNPQSHFFPPVHTTQQHVNPLSHDLDPPPVEFLVGSDSETRTSRKDTKTTKRLFRIFRFLPRHSCFKCPHSPQWFSDYRRSFPSVSADDLHIPHFVFEMASQRSPSKRSSAGHSPSPSLLPSQAKQSVFVNWRRNSSGIRVKRLLGASWLRWHWRARSCTSK